MKNSLVVILTFGLFLPVPATFAGKDARPNIIFILSDDQGYQDLGCQGAVGIKTPRIDQMAAEDVRLTSFYAKKEE